MDKKGDPAEPANSPPLDIAQGGFRESRGPLDQALCLAEICNILRHFHHITPVLAFLDIKSAYDTVDRRCIWKNLEQIAPTTLVSLLQNLFDEVQIEVLLNNATSTRFSPAAGVLQGSILSPFLYSIYINELPRLLCPQPLTTDISPTELALRMNCLLYADDVVLIAAKADMPTLLKSCEDHSYQLGYRWNPTIPSMENQSQNNHLFPTSESLFVRVAISTPLN
ncbi:hypothetical protein RMATCC62417_10098 [Rhizopus microsporus]|nr:hypothetical protein RMATCC62417_10098 [Rhizopus microsporus]